jgi:SpoVK/Ycf46/Vps4 family AAA+-type ATPase
MNRLILLAGPPGTGKTTLSQALAQKLSIRLSSQYTSIKLIQINAATLLSKFFSESAKYILQIFTSIERMCVDNPKHFICVLIDEIESLASSRATASNRGEVQDGIRATNALLTGFDRVKSQSNLIILCTSNMVDTLDAAFLDRCGYQIVVEAPSIAGRYQILRDAIQNLIDGGIITMDDDEGVPSYRDAQLALLTEPKRPGSMLNALCESLEVSVPHSPTSSLRRSARFLGQLPEVALAERMITDSCTLNQALEYMTRFVKNQKTLPQGNKRKVSEDLDETGGNDRKRNEKVQRRSKKETRRP